MNLPSWIVDPNSNRINFHEPFELQYWVQEWRITEQQLREAKEKTGSSIVIELYKHLKQSGLIIEETGESKASFFQSIQA